jgi:hypothetical protein
LFRAPVRPHEVLDTALHFWYDVSSQPNRQHLPLVSAAMCFLAVSPPHTPLQGV